MNGLNIFRNTFSIFWGSKMQYLLGCLGVLIILGIIVAIVSWIFNNIVAIIGLAFLGYGIYQWRMNKKINIRSKIPAIMIAIGIVFTIAGLSSSDENVA